MSSRPHALAFALSALALTGFVACGSTPRSSGFDEGHDGGDPSADGSLNGGDSGAFDLDSGAFGDGAAVGLLKGTVMAPNGTFPVAGALVYLQFIGKVAAARGKQPAEIDTIARGRSVWSGAQAMERGLVDQLGTLQDAIADAATRAKLGDAFRVSYVEKELDPLQRFLANTLQSGAAAWIKAAGVAIPGAWVLPDSVGADVDAARRLVQDALVQKPVAMYAHCECDLN